VATLQGDTEVHTGPAADSPATDLPATWHGATLTLPVLDAIPGWLDVRLPGRPNGATGWVASDVVTLDRTPYHIVIDLAARRLELYQQAKLVLDAPAGIGTAQYPTPVGHFFVALFAQSPGPEWGPFVIVTSAHSDTITDWEDSGDALVAIHGPLGDDAEIGTTGAAISHGCIRLHVPDLDQLRAVPVGTPVDVVAGGGSAH
jgi:lipoprotein-anchoring transpeptidase ErfK/SrfK